jgi:tRNA(Ile)-lysidine synthase
VRQAIERHRMLSAGDLAIVAVSGGPDSMCLLDVLASLSGELGIRLHAAHLHHHMREQADSDARMVAGFAGSLDIPCTVGHADVPGFARDTGVGIEEAGRMARYRFLREVKRETGAQKILLGHNLNDQAETVLMRLFRGGGTEGLAGIPPLKDDLARPLLSIPRRLIEEYCRERNVPTILDVYNLDLRYTRNVVRHRVLPDLAAQFNPSLVETLARVATAMRWDADFLGALASDAFLGVSSMQGRVTAVDRRAIRDMPPTLSSRVLEQAWRECAGSSANLPLDRVEELVLGPKKTVSLPEGVTAEKALDIVRFYPRPQKGFEVDLVAPGETDVPQLGLSVVARVVSVAAGVAEGGVPGSGAGARETSAGEPARVDAPAPWLVEPVARLDYNKIRGRIWIRTRRDGDRFAPLGMAGKEQKLQDFFVQRRVPRFYRDFVPVLVCGDKIVWVMGLRLSEEFKVVSETKRILEVEVRPYLRRSRNYATIWRSCPTSGRVYS